VCTLHIHVRKYSSNVIFLSMHLGTKNNASRILTASANNWASHKHCLFSKSYSRLRIIAVRFHRSDTTDCCPTNSVKAELKASTPTTKTHSLASPFSQSNPFHNPASRHFRLEGGLWNGLEYHLPLPSHALCITDNIILNVNWKLNFRRAFDHWQLTIY